MTARKNVGTDTQSGEETTVGFGEETTVGFGEDSVPGTMLDFHIMGLNSVKATNDILAEGGNQFIADNARRENIIVEAILYMFNAVKSNQPDNIPE